MPPFDALLFDLGNTLIYFDGDRPLVFAQADAELLHHLKLAGLNLEGEAFLEDFRNRLSDYFTERESAFVEYTTAHILRTLLADWGYPQLSTSAHWLNPLGLASHVCCLGGSLASRSRYDPHVEHSP